MIGEALRFPANGDDAVKNVLIGGLLLIGSFLILPAFVALGYYYRVLGVATRGETEPPAFDEWGDMMVDGLKVFVVMLAYSLLSAIPVTLAMVVGGGVALTGEGMGGVGLLLMLVGVVASIAVTYVLPAALSNMAREDDVGAAFDVDVLRQAATSGDYFFAVVLAIVVGGVLGFVAGLLSLLLVGIFLSFYVNVAMYYLFGSGFRAAVESAGDADATAPEAAGA